MTVNRLDGSRPVPHPDDPAAGAGVDAVPETGTEAAANQAAANQVGATAPRVATPAAAPAVPATPGVAGTRESGDAVSTRPDATTGVTSPPETSEGYLPRHDVPTGAAPTGDTSNVVDVLRRIGELVDTLRADTPGGGVAARVVRSGGGGSPTDQTVEVVHEDGSVNGWVIPGTPSVEK